MYIHNIYIITSSCIYIYIHSIYIVYYTQYIYTVYDGLPKYLFLVWLINRNSLRAASYLVFKILNSLKPRILSFMFEAVAKTCSKC